MLRSIAILLWAILLRYSSACWVVVYVTESPRGASILLNTLYLFDLSEYSVLKSKLELSAKIPRLAPSVRLSLLTTDEPLSPAYVPTDFLIAFLKDLDSLI